MCGGGEGKRTEKRKKRKMCGQDVQLESALRGQKIQKLKRKKRSGKRGHSNPSPLLSNVSGGDTGLPKGVEGYVKRSQNIYEIVERKKRTKHLQLTASKKGFRQWPHAA